MSALGLAQRVENESRRLGVALDPASAAAMETHYHLLTRWSRAVNLTAARDLQSILPLYMEPLQVLDQFRPEGEGVLIDLGSGAGFPALILAILRPTWRVALVERGARKAAFLSEAVRELGLRGAEVVERNVRRASDLPSGLRPDRLTAKAFGQFGLTLELIEELGPPGARAILFTGREGGREVDRRVSERGGTLRILEERRLAGRQASLAIILERGAQKGEPPGRAKGGEVISRESHFDG